MRTQFCLFIAAFSALASLPLKASFEQGKALGQQMLNQAGNLPSRINPAGVVPQYTSNPAEASLSAESLEGKARASFQSNPSAQLLKESEQNRGRFFKLSEDPLVRFSKEISADPLALLSRYYKDCREVPVEGNSEKPETETKTCEEAAEPYRVSCTRDLHVQTVQKTKIYKQSHIHGYMFKRYHVGGNPQYSNPHISGYGHDGRYNVTVHDPSLAEVNWRFHDGANWYAHHVRNEYSYTKGFSGEDPIPITEQDYNSPNLGEGDIREQWTSTCDTFEEKIDQGLCEYVEKRCTQGPETRMINGFPITKECWQETLTYQCMASSKNDCEGLRAKGCRQVHSECQEYVGNQCVVYRQTFECVNLSSLKGKGINTKIVCGEAPRCLSGDCGEQGYPLNGEMLQVISQLSVLKELQNQMKDGVPEIFKGEANRCSRNCVDFRDCCGSGNGWGVEFHLASCTPEEKALSLKRQKKQCHRVGTWCSKKALGFCLEKKTSFCCFGSSFLRTIQEQARSQIGLGWGSAKSPLCRGLSVEELSRVDFSKLDLSEIFHEVSGRYKQSSSKDMEKKLQERLEEIQGSLQKDPNARQRGEG